MAKDAKTMLKEEADKGSSQSPSYSTDRHGGPDHRPGFTSTVADAKGNVAQGVGSTKKEAEKHAAAALINKRPG